MVSTWIFLLLVCGFPNIILSEVSESTLAKYVTSQDDDLGISGLILFHTYRFKNSFDFASQLISTTMNYNVELGDLVRSYARDTTDPGNDEYNAKDDECYKRLLELPWFNRIKADLIKRLTATLAHLIEKDTTLAERVADCGMYNVVCVEHVTYRARIEISSYGHSELENELAIKQEYLGKIRYEMDTCLFPTQGGISGETK